MSNLIKALRAKLELTEYMRDTLRHIKEYGLDDDFTEGAQAENTRLKPILEKMLAVIEAADQIGHSFIPLEKSLAELRESLG